MAKTYKTEMVGKEFGPFVREYNQRELMIFGLGCGAAYDGKTDLEYVYEKDLKVLPMYYAMPIVDSEVTKTIDWGFEWGGSLHWGFDFKVIKPLDTKKAGKLSTKVTLKGLFDRGEGKGTLAQHYGETFDEDGNLLFTNESWDCAIFDGGWDGPKAPKDIVEMPEREPDFEVTETIPLNQACIYRLSGDYHPQHIDWEYAQKFGYPKPNLHAISTAGAACRHIIRTICPGHPEKLVRFKTRITKPMFPGSTMTTQIWKMEDGSIRFRCINAEDPSYIYLNFALAEFK